MVGRDWRVLEVYGPVSLGYTVADGDAVSKQKGGRQGPMLEIVL